MGALDTAVRMLARREHSAFELRRKLKQKAFDDADIEDALEHLHQDGLQSDSRFAEAYVHMRIGKGYGPLRIALELKERGVAESDYGHCLYDTEHDWAAVLKTAYQKKYGSTDYDDYRDKAKRIRYLQYRGFALEMIFELI